MTGAAPRPSSARVPYFDAVKGLAIVAVLMGHAFVYQRYVPGTFDYGFAAAGRNFIDFTVSTFLGLSGYFAARGKGGFGWDQVPSRLWRILVPYLVAAVVYVLLRDPAILLRPMGLAWLLVTGRATIVGYFVIVLVQFTLLTPIISRIESRRTHLGIIAVLSVAGLAFTYYNQLLVPDSVWSTFPLNVLPFFVWYPFYHLGFLIGKDADLRAALVRARWLWLLLPLTIGASLLEAFLLWYDRSLSMATSQTKITTIASSTVILLLLLRRGIQVPPPAASRLIHALAQAGAASYFIYLYHLLILPDVADALRAVAPSEPFVVVSASLIAVVVLTFAAQILRKVLGAPRAQLIFGA